MNKTAQSIMEDYSAEPIIQPCGKVLKSRGGGLTPKVEMVYWGKDAEQKITIVVTDDRLGECFYLAPRDDDTTDAFLHPYSGYEVFAPPVGLKEMYA